jgi:hypothetical protein
MSVPNGESVVQAYSAYCSEIRRDDSQQDVLSYVLFPGEEPRGQGIIENIGYQQITAVKEIWNRRTGQDTDFKYIKLSIIGCITYRIAVDDRQHQTGFMIDVWRRQSGTINVGMINLEETTVPMENLALYHHPLGSPSID